MKNPFEEAEEEFENRFMPSKTEYIVEFRAVIEACGNVGYHFKMLENLKNNNPKAQAVATAYQRSPAYYQVELKYYVNQAREAFKRLGLQATRFGFNMPDENSYLNGLALYEDRRDCYKYYLKNHCEKKGKILSPFELESKYQLRLRKREKKGE